MRRYSERLSRIASSAIAATVIVSVGMAGLTSTQAKDPHRLSWQRMPDLPESLGVAGPFVGIHNDALIVAGGANFPHPVWETSKVFHDRIHVLVKGEREFVWLDGGRLPRPAAYGAAVSTDDGVVCIGGNDSVDTFDKVLLLRWDASARQMAMSDYPTLPTSCAYAAAAMIGNVIYVAGGQSDQSLESAMTNLWSLDLSKKAIADEFVWQQLPGCPGPSRAFNLMVSQRNGDDDCLYVISGRRQKGPSDDSTSFEFLKDVWEFTPATKKWRPRKEVPRCVMAGTGIAVGQSQILVLGGATEELFFRSNELKDDHPGFIKQSLSYDTITDTWIEAGATPANHVTTTAVKWGDDIIIPSGEVRPRVRSPNVYRVVPIRTTGDVEPKTEPQTEQNK